MKNENRLFDDSCSICVDNFRDREEIILTPCNHSYHETCLISWVNSSVDKILILKKEAEVNGGQLAPDQCEPECPNCSVSLLKAPNNPQDEEIEAIDQIMIMLDSDSKMLDESGM